MFYSKIITAEKVKINTTVANGKAKAKSKATADYGITTEDRQNAINNPVFFTRLFNNIEGKKLVPKELTSADVEALKALIRNPDNDKSKTFSDVFKSFLDKIIGRKPMLSSIFGGEQNNAKDTALAKVLQNNQLKIVVEPVSFDKDRFNLVYLKGREDNSFQRIYINTIIFKGNVLSQHAGLKDKILIESITDENKVMHTYFSFDANNEVLEVLKRLGDFAEKCSSGLLAKHIVEVLMAVYSRKTETTKLEEDVWLSIPRLLEKTGNELSLLDLAVNSVKNFNKKYHTSIPIYFKIKRHEEIDINGDLEILKAYVSSFHNEGINIDFIVEDSDSEHFKENDLILNIAPENVGYAMQLGGLRNMAFLSEAIALLENKRKEYIVASPTDLDIGIGKDFSMDDYKPTKVFWQESDNSLRRTMFVEKNWGFSSLSKSEEITIVGKKLLPVYENYLLRGKISVADDASLYISNEHYADEVEIGGMIGSKGFLTINSLAYLFVSGKIRIEGRLRINRNSVCEFISRGGHKVSFFLGADTRAYTKAGSKVKIITERNAQLVLDYDPVDEILYDDTGYHEVGTTVSYEAVSLLSKIIPENNVVRVLESSKDIVSAVSSILNKGNICILCQNKEYRETIRNNMGKLMAKDLIEKVFLYESINEFDAKHDGKHDNIALFILFEEDYANAVKKNKINDLTYNSLNKYAGVISILIAEAKVNERFYHKIVSETKHNLILATKTVELSDNSGNYEENIDLEHRMSLSAAIINASSNIQGDID